jgi:hypothetical protein
MSSVITGRAVIVGRVVRSVSVPGDGRKTTEERRHGAIHRVFLDTRPADLEISQAVNAKNIQPERILSVFFSVSSVSLWFKPNGRTARPGS